MAPNMKEDRDNQFREPSNGDGRKIGRLNGCFHQYRFVVAMLSGMAWGIMFFLRYNMTVAVWQMVNQTHLYLEEHPNKTLQNFVETGLSPGGEFLWNNEIVATILGHYMISYTLPQTFVAKLNIAVGCRWAIPIGLAMCSVSSLLTPAAAYLGWQWVLACRLINGLGASGIIPGMLALFEDWLRYDELSLGLTFGTVVAAGMTSVCPLATGYLAAAHWSLAFYVPSYVTLAFCLVFIVLITNKPDENWLISSQELDYLKNRSSTNETELEIDKKSSIAGGQKEAAATATSTSYKPDSWLQIFEQPALYFYMAIWVSHNICFNAFVFTLPAYVGQFLKIEIAENGLYCFIIQSGLLFAILWPHSILKWLLKLKLTMTQARNILQALCSFMMAATFCYVGLFHQYQVPMLLINRCFLTADIILTGSVMSNFALAGLGSVAFAIINTVGGLSVAGAAPVVGFWLDYTSSSRWGWQMLFFGLATTQMVIFFIFWLFVDSEPIKFKNKSKSVLNGTN